jgi:hypothetical protein
VRQIYIYVVAAATLVIAAIGVINLLGVGIDLLLSAVTGQDWNQGGPDWERERLSFALPFIVIATPIWFLHWRMAERAVSGPDSDAERRSEVRALYFALAFLAGLFLLPGISTVISLLVEAWLGNPLTGTERESAVTSLAVGLVTAAGWVFHRRLYSRDVGAETTEARSTLLPQISLYAVSAIGGIALLFGVSDLIRLAVDTMADAGTSEHWWRESLATGLGSIVAGGLLWGVTWFYTERLLTTSAWWGKSAAGSGVRRAFLLAATVLAGLVVIINIADASDVAVSLALDARERAAGARPRSVAGPLLASLPFVAAWVLSRRRLLAEPDRIGFPLPLVTAQRLFGYVMALLGLLLGSAGVAMLLGDLIQLAAGVEDWRADLGRALGLAVAGGVLWGWYWRATLARFARDPVAEQYSSARRAYLFVVLGAALVALVIGLAITVYQVLQVVLDVSGADRLAAAIALPLGITIATAGVALYHGVLLRRDLAVRATVERTEAVEEEQAAAGRTQVALVVTGPAQGDTFAVIDALRRQLPEGYDISNIST